MSFQFDPEGHLCLDPERLFEHAKLDPRATVNNYLLVGTLWVFATYAKYRAFLRDVATRLHIPPQSIAMRGSSHLGFSIAPRPDKAWQKRRKDSDIDIAIVDVAYFERLDTEVRAWEGRNLKPNLRNREDVKRYARRQQLRASNCIDDDTLPRNTCVPHRDAMADIDTTPHCGARQDVSAFVFRDWWSLRNRYEDDLKELCEKVTSGIVLPPQPIERTAPP